MLDLSLIFGKGNKVPDDLSVPTMRKDVINIVWPALTELFLVQLCTMVDTMMVGRLGSWALASVGYCSQPKFLLQAAFVAVNTGGTALIARAKGAGDKELANNVMRQGIVMVFVLSLILSITGFFASTSLVKFMGADSDITIANATAYMQIQMSGFVFNALTLAVTASLRGIGVTRVSMIYNLIANVVNVFLNWTLIYGNLGMPKLGVAGASIATVIGQTTAFCIAMAVISRKDSYLRLEYKKLLDIDFSLIKRVLRIGLPAMGEQIVLRTGMLIFTLTVTSLGEQIYAAHQISANILSMSIMNGQAFGIAATSLLGQSLGRKRIDHGKAYVLLCRRYAMYVSILLAATFFFFGRYIAMLYNDEPFIIEQSARVLMVVAFLQPLQSSQHTVSGALRGAGDTRFVAVISFIGIILVRPFMSYIFIKYCYMGLMGAWLAMSLDHAGRALLSLIRFNSEKWAAIKV